MILFILVCVGLVVVGLRNGKQEGCVSTFQRLRFVFRNINSLEHISSFHKLWIISGLSGEEMKLISGWREDREAVCRHIASFGSRKGEYLVYPYPDSFDVPIEYIWCAACYARWYPTDTIEYLFRNNQKCPNHTRLGWREACAMLFPSRATSESSEIVEL